MGSVKKKVNKVFNKVADKLVPKVNFSLFAINAIVCKL